MSKHPLHDAAYRCDLGEGLVLRWAAPEDCEGLEELFSYVFRAKAEDPPNTQIALWTRSMFDERYPLSDGGSFAVVEDTARGRIVAGACLLEQTWEYGGIPFGVGRPEIVASHPEYRNRGLVRAVFELIHARSAWHGHVAQGITGIPYYYRQFGYEYALDLGGARRVNFTAIPRLKETEQERYSLREASEADLPFLLRLYERERTRIQDGRPLLVSARIPEEYWRYQLQGHSEEAGEGWRTLLLQDREERALGYVLIRRRRHGEVLSICGLAVEPGVSLLAAMPSLLRALQAQAQELPASAPQAPAASALRFVLGRRHPCYEVLGQELVARTDQPYAWYIRVPELPVFLRQIAPVLEQRLAESPASGHSGELRIDFYRGGLQLRFEQGRLAAVEHWRASHSWGPRAQAGLPSLVFLQLLFGHRSLEQLRAIFPDVWADSEAAVMLDTLFPARLSWVLPLD